MDSFKSRIAQTCIDVAKEYDNYFVKYEYLICSKAFSEKSYYIIDAHKDNFLHLVGVGTNLSANDFFSKCLEHTLQEDDFSFSKKNKNEKAVKGTVRRKLSVLPEIVHIFDSPIMVEENFKKNEIICSFAVSNTKCTLGFTRTEKAKPKTLLVGDILDCEKSKEIDLVLRKKKGTTKFDEIVYGEQSALLDYFYTIETLIDKEIMERIKSEGLT